MRTHLRRIVVVALAATAACLSVSPAIADRMPEMDADTILQVTERWKNRVFVVVADGGPGHVPVKKVLADPKALYRKRRVGCAIFLGSGRHLLTTASMTTGGSEVEIFDGEGRHVLARVVGTDNFLDLALLETLEDIPGTEDVGPLDFGTEPEAGQPCLILGNAWGRDLFATLGRLAGTLEISPGGVPTRAHRVLAAIYPGDSGALVLDGEGRFVGLVTGVSDPGRHPVLEHVGEIGNDASSGPAGKVGFAVPARECRRAWMDLRDFGHVRRGFLGVRVAATSDLGHGATVLNVVPGGPADVAGLVPGDVLTTFGSLFIRGGGQLCAYVASAEPFEAVKVHVLRDGREHIVSVEVGVTAELPKMHSVTLEDLGFPTGQRPVRPEPMIPVVQGTSPR
ncbi:MAG: hypothetical protein DHS20C21_20510 [Gemmatimonadota bacterium]|nr:MAG: hypothetical protein DHS20C21_20510 [Gemmatimonadota bacterium]